MTKITKQQLELMPRIQVTKRFDLEDEEGTIHTFERGTKSSNLTVLGNTTIITMKVYFNNLTMRFETWQVLEAVLSGKFKVLKGVRYEYQ